MCLITYGRYKEAIKNEKELRQLKQNAEELFQINRMKKMKQGLRKLIDNHRKEEIELDKQIDKLKKNDRYQRRKSFSRFEVKNNNRLDLIKTIHSSELNNLKDILYITNSKFGLFYLFSQKI